MQGGLSLEDRGALRPVLEDARRRGYLGPGPVEGHIDHALACGDVVAGALASASSGWPYPAKIIDLGSGGGIPGIVLALHWPLLTLTLLEAQERRATFLREAVARLGLADRVEAVRARAEDLGRTPTQRAHYKAAVARSFAPPAVTAECAAPFLEPGGRLVVSEPPESGSTRWPADGLAQLGMRFLGNEGAEYHFAVIEQVTLCPERFPRRAGVPAKRPLF